MPRAQRNCTVLVLSLAFLLSAPLHAQMTETPHTVAPGKVLVEMDGVRLSLDRSGEGKFTGIGVASTIISAGLTNSLDVQAGLDVFLKETVEEGGSRDSQSGLGDLSFRMKWTFWRNESLGSAMAVMPYVKLPSSTSGVGGDKLQGGVIVPWEMKLRTSTMLGAMVQWDVIRNDREDGYDAHWHTTGFLHQQLTRAFGIYGEATLVATTTGWSDSSGTIGVGGVLQLTNAVLLDYELQRGLNSRTADWTHVLRVNWGW